MEQLARPNPDQLLNKLQKLEHGKLTIFLGAAAGVGKTYAMLKALASLCADKVDAVIGYIETHNRADTQALVPTHVEIIPLKTIEYKGHTLTELDVDGILARAPQLVVIDELAHNNASGSRNVKRYQDVLEILKAGIDVYTALNIQHIESLNDVVSQITGVKVKETVPDYIIEQAHEVKLIDVTPDELIERLREGKIYNLERARKALENFFRKGNLTALRELALVKTARKVERQVQEYRIEQAIQEVWTSHDKLMVVLETNYPSEKIIRSGKTMADKGFSGWYVVAVTNHDLARKSLKARSKLLELLQLATTLGAQTEQLSGYDLALLVVNFAREKNISTIVLSQYRLNLYYRLFGKSLVDRIRELAPEINLHLVTDRLITTKSEAKQMVMNQPKLSLTSLARKVVINGLAFSLFGLIMLPLGARLAHANVILMYLLAIIVLNQGRSITSAVIAALMATISYDFFFVPPIFSFAVSDLQYIFTFLAMAGVGAAFSIVNGNLRFQVSQLLSTQTQLRLLYQFSKTLAEAMIEQQVIEACNEFIPRLFQARFSLLLPNLNEELNEVTNQLDSNLDVTIARWVFDNAQPAGLNTNTFSAANAYYLALNSSIRTRGVIVFSPDDQFKFFLPTQQELLANFASSVATTLERIHFTQIAIQTQVTLATLHQDEL
jgi:two-component system sensor histidine kinase KdpD